MNTYSKPFKFKLVPVRKKCSCLKIYKSAEYKNHLQTFWKKWAFLASENMWADKQQQNFLVEEKTH